MLEERNNEGLVPRLDTLGYCQGPQPLRYYGGGDSHPGQEWKGLCLGYYGSIVCVVVNIPTG